MKEESRKIIRKCASLCRKSYDKAEMSRDGFQPISSDETGLDCFIKSEDGITWVVFRGTETDQLNDVCTDLMTFRVKTPFLPDECRVHAGFLGQYMSGRTLIIDTIKYMANPKVVCTGHSLGGGLSTLCALDVEQNVEGDVETYCVTYGSPRVGGGHFCRLFDAVIDNSFRFVDVNDPIPRVPLRAWDSNT
jgi:triacylglycerol lipase